MNCSHKRVYSHAILPPFSPSLLPLSSTFRPSPSSHFYRLFLFSPCRSALHSEFTFAYSSLPHLLIFFSVSSRFLILLYSAIKCGRSACPILHNGIEQRSFSVLMVLSGNSLWLLPGCFLFWHSLWIFVSISLSPFTHLLFRSCVVVSFSFQPPIIHSHALLSPLTMTSEDDPAVCTLSGYLLSHSLSLRISLISPISVFADLFIIHSLLPALTPPPPPPLPSSAVKSVLLPFSSSLILLSFDHLLFGVISSLMNRRKEERERE